MTPATKRLLFWGLPALLLAAALLWLFRPAAVAVDLVTVDRGPLLVDVSDEGETRVRDMYVVSAPVPGLMRRIGLDMPMEKVPEQYLQLVVAPDRAADARALKPLTERQLLGRHVYLFEGADPEALADLGEVRQPSIADLFVAKVQGGAA